MEKQIHVKNELAKNPVKVEKENHKVISDSRIDELLSELKTLEEEYKNSQDKIRTLLSSVPVGILLVDKVGTIFVANQVALNMFGYLPNVIAGKNIEVILPKFDSKASQNIEMFAFTASGRSFPAEITVVEAPNMKEDRLFVFISDITSRHTLEQMKKDFVAMLGHDLKAPLMSLSGIIELTREGKLGELNPYGEKQFEIANRSLNRLLQMITELLDLEKMESGQIMLETENNSLTKAVASAIMDLERLYRVKNIEITAFADEISLDFDGKRIHRVLVNLLSNAIKFAPQNSGILVSLGGNAEWIEVSIIDEGPGIADEDKEIIFTKYSQLKYNQGENQIGTGLGLAICKSIIEAHGGAIGVKDRTDGKNGTIFWFKLPR